MAHRILGDAIAEARRRGYLGDDVLGEGFAFDIEIRKGAGAYICGEETAIFNSIEGFRGEPRNKPPFPVDAGLFGKPTVVNNVETLVNVLDVLAGGGPAYAATGTEASTGTKLFCVSGNVERARRLRGAVRRHAARAARRWPAALPAGRDAAGGAARRRGRRLRRPRRARPAAHLGGGARGQDHARLGRRAGDRRHASTCRACCCASRRSSATSRAASACPAASAPCASRRRWRASSAATAAATRSS